MLNKVKDDSNMYSWINYTWNPIRGECPHDCDYCYVKRFPQGELRLDEKCLKDNLGNNNIIFVGSSNDLFQEDVPEEWIIKTLEHCKNYPKNTYLFQSKNPKRFFEFKKMFPINTIFGTTIETTHFNKHYSNAPTPVERMIEMGYLESPIDIEDSKIFKRRMISIEPIMLFDLDVIVRWIKDIKPEFVSIGADSKGHNLPEPSKEEIESLIKELKKFTEVRVKDNLKRLVK